MRMFKFSRPMITTMYGNLPRYTVYEIHQIDPKLYIEMVDRLQNILLAWIVQEQQYAAPANEDDYTFLHMLRNINLHMFASTLPKYKSYVNALFNDNNKTQNTLHRLYELNTRVRYLLPKEFISTIEGTIYETITSYRYSDILPTKTDWYIFVNKYPFTWLMFILQNILVSKKPLL